MLEIGMAILGELERVACGWNVVVHHIQVKYVIHCIKFVFHP
jgi:hypothetical protein